MAGCTRDPNRNDRLALLKKLRPPIQSAKSFVVGLPLLACDGEPYPNNIKLDFKGRAKKQSKQVTIKTSLCRSGIGGHRAPFPGVSELDGAPAEAAEAFLAFFAEPCGRKLCSIIGPPQLHREGLGRIPKNTEHNVRSENLLQPRTARNSRSPSGQKTNRRRLLLLQSRPRPLCSAWHLAASEPQTENKEVAVDRNTATGNFKPYSTARKIENPAGSRKKTTTNNDYLQAT